MRYSPRVHATLENLHRQLAAALTGLSDHDTQAQRAPGKWTIQQIVEHLTLTYSSTYNVVAARIAKSIPTKRSPSLPQRIGQFTITTCGIFPTGHTAPLAATPQQTPVHPQTGPDLSTTLRHSLVQMDQTLTAAGALFGPNRRAITHIALGPMSVNQWRRFHLAHGQHHLKQILATRKILAG